MTFKSLGLNPKLLQGLDDLGFTEPTPIQKDAIPPGLEGRDILACAMTGSGKTAAFLLPLLDYMLEEDVKGPRVLVVVPTRELALQVAEDMVALAKHTKLRVAAIFGGVGMEPQVKMLRRGVDVIVATPGRLLDHLRNQGLNLAPVEALVLDEADRMLDMGFLPDVKRVLSFVPKDRQTLFFSATLPSAVAKLADEMLEDPVKIAVERRSAPAEGVSQRVFEVAPADKTQLVLDLLNTGTLESAIVFTRTKHRANRLHAFLEKRGVSAARIHGNRSQAQRQKALGDFKKCAVKVLVATDIAARGIDVENLSHVVNFDVPNLPEDYIHRVGRTARAQKTGDAFTFVTPEDLGDLKEIERALGKTIPRAMLTENGEIELVEASLRGRGSRSKQLRGRAARAQDDADFGPDDSKAAKPASNGRRTQGGSTGRRPARTESAGRSGSPARSESSDRSSAPSRGGSSERSGAPAREDRSGPRPEGKKRPPRKRTRNRKPAGSGAQGSAPAGREGGQRAAAPGTASRTSGGKPRRPGGAGGAPQKGHSSRAPGGNRSSSSGSASR